MQLKQARGLPGLAAGDTKPYLVADEVSTVDRPRSGISRIQPSTERRARTTTVATLATAQARTRALADSKHAGRRAAWATPRTGGLGQSVPPKAQAKGTAKSRSPQ